MTSPTELTADDHQRAYRHFNTTLFDGRLPPCLITLSEGRYRGYFKPNCFRHARDQDRVDEISMNPATYTNLETYLSTLVHEMCHLEQEHFGRPGKPPYHNAEWASLMKRVGLQPHSVEKKFEHRETGRRVSHTIVTGGPFEAACRDFLQTGYHLTYLYDPAPPRRDLEQDPDEDEDARREEERKRKKRDSKTRFTCRSCGMNAWAKVTAKLACGHCKEPLVRPDPHPNDVVDHP